MEIKSPKAVWGPKCILLYTMYGFEWMVENNNKKMLLWTADAFFVKKIKNSLDRAELSVVGGGGGGCN